MNGKIIILVAALVYSANGQLSIEAGLPGIGGGLGTGLVGSLGLGEGFNALSGLAAELGGAGGLGAGGLGAGGLGAGGLGAGGLGGLGGISTAFNPASIALDAGRFAVGLGTGLGAQAANLGKMFGNGALGLASSLTSRIPLANTATVPALQAAQAALDQGIYVGQQGLQAGKGAAYGALQTAETVTGGALPSTQTLQSAITALPVGLNPTASASLPRPTTFIGTPAITTLPANLNTVQAQVLPGTYAVEGFPTYDTVGTVVTVPEEQVVVTATN